MSDPYHDEETDRILGITRCARCGHRLGGEVECPFCSAMRGVEGPERELKRVPLWIYLTAMLLTFPLSSPWLLMSRRLSVPMKAATFAACIFWMYTVIWFI